MPGEGAPASRRVLSQSRSLWIEAQERETLVTTEEEPAMSRTRQQREDLISLGVFALWVGAGIWRRKKDRERHLARPDPQPSPPPRLWTEPPRPPSVIEPQPETAQAAHRVETEEERAQRLAAAQAEVTRRNELTGGRQGAFDNVMNRPGGMGAWNPMRPPGT
jgi:hypothetical protein